MDDLYTPEINAGGTTNNLAATRTYDYLKVAAVLNWIDGKDHAGATTVGVPAIFGMNFQAVSVGQKLLSNGYLEAGGTPSPGLADALDHASQSIGQMVNRLEANGLLKSTLIVISAKHGNSPADPAKLRLVNPNVIVNAVNGVQAGLLAQLSADTGALIWLKDQSKTAAAVTALAGVHAAAGIQEIISGDGLKLLFNDPLKDSRTPDVMITTILGTVYTTSDTKIADHGGVNQQDIHVPILLSHPGYTESTIKDPVETTQIACTILQALGIGCENLTASRSTHVRPLPFRHGRKPQAGNHPKTPAPSNIAALPEPTATPTTPNVKGAAAE